MCQEGMGHVDYDAKRVGTLPEPKVVVQRFADNGLPRLPEGRRPEPMPMAWNFARPVDEVAAVREAVDVVNGPVAGGVNEVNDVLVQVGSVGEPKDALGSVAPRGVEVESVSDEVKLESVYEILSDPALSQSDEVAVVLARALGVALPSAKHPAKDLKFVSKLRTEILRVAEANGMDEETIRSSGLLPEFMEKV